MTKATEQKAVTEKDVTGEVIDQTTGEISKSQSLVPETKSVSDLLKTVKLKRRVTIPLLKQRVGVPIAIVFLTPLYLGQAIEKSKIRERPTMAQVWNLQDDRVYLLILSTVEKSELMKIYPSSELKEKAFVIETAAAGEGKNYHVADIAEIELPEGWKMPDGIAIPKDCEVIS